MAGVGKYLSIVALLLIITAIGYAAFYAFVITKTLPALYGLYLFSIIAGIATFFNPCSFGLLPGYLAYFFTLRAGPMRPSAGKMLGYGLMSAAGLLAFAVILGVVIGALGTGLGQALGFAGEFGFVPQIVRVVLGAALLLFGFAALFHISLPLIGRLVRIAPARAEKRSLLSLFSYGFVYNMVGIACAGPILAGLLALALASGFAAALGAFLIYAATMATLMIGISLMVALASKEGMHRLIAASPKILKISAGVLVAVGAYILISGIYPAFFTSLFIPG